VKDLKLPNAFVQLPLRFDAQRLAEEVAALGEDTWRPHPQNFPGNAMLPLIASNGEAGNESFAPPMQPTPALHASPCLWQTVATLGATLGRTRLMRLDGKAEVTPHADQGYYWAERTRVHIPIVTAPDVRFICGESEVHMAAGECWIFDTWRIHQVINGPTVRRIHLVIDTVGGARFWDFAAKGRAHPSNADYTRWAAREVAFQSDARPDLVLENVSIPEVMTPWEIESRLGFLLSESTNHPNMDKLRDHAAIFVRDWRGLWAQFGIGAQGKAHYRARRDAFVAAVRPLAAPITLLNELNLFNAILAGLCNVIIGEDSPVQGRNRANAYVG